MRSKKKLWTCHEIKKLFFSKPSPSSHPTRPKHHKFTNKWALQNVFVTNFFSPFVASKIEFVICKNFKIAIVPVLHLRWNHSYYFLMRSWRQWPPLDVRPLRMRIFARIQTLSFCILPVWKKVKKKEGLLKILWRTPITRNISLSLIDKCETMENIINDDDEEKKVVRWLWQYCK